MTIEIANKFIKLRKDKGYSQEQLADLLGVSRQAVSKWERAESSPDTDNLIALAKLYEISLDELLDIKNYQVEVKEEKKNDDGFSKIEKAITFGCVALALIIYLLLGFLLGMWGTMWVLFLYAIVVPSFIEAIHYKSFTKFNYPVFVASIYLTLSLFLHIWHPLWIIFLTIPIYYPIFGKIDSRIHR